MNAPPAVLSWQVDAGRAVARRRDLADLWLEALGLALLLYATLGRGGAYIGVAPLYIGELILLGGIVLVAFAGIWKSKPLPAPANLLVLLILWGLARCIPCVREHKMDALRDSVAWGYALFAFLVFYLLLDNPDRLKRLIHRYGQFATIYVLSMPVLWGARYVLGDRMPSWPWADVRIIDPKPGDAMVHLSGVLAFWVAATAGNLGLVRPLVMAACAAVVGAYERAGMLAFMGSFGLCALFRPSHPLLRQLVGAAVAGLVLLAATGVQLEVPVAESAKVREVSFHQLVENVTSVFNRSTMGDLDDTKEWRLMWWKEIASYTLSGDYFWTGKGYGVNLADDDGFQVMEDHSLRSPHSIHLVFLARGGVPGLVLWLLVQFTWAASVIRALIQSVRCGETHWAGIMLFLLAYWLAFMVNASFDVFLEGPMGGIWFWSLFGFGLAAVQIHARRPQLLATHAYPDRS